MSDLKSRLKPVFRRSSSAFSAKPPVTATESSETPGLKRSGASQSLRSKRERQQPTYIPVAREKDLPALPPKIPLGTQGRRVEDLKSSGPDTPGLRLEHASPDPQNPTDIRTGKTKSTENPNWLGETHAITPGGSTNSLAARRHSPIAFDHTNLFSSHNRDSSPERLPERSIRPNYTRRGQSYGSMQHRKVWVKRPNATATQVSVSADDLVDDVKDMILRKYANSLGRNFDPPDVCLKLVVGAHSVRHTNERTLAPDESISKILDLHYPDGQSIDEALHIDVPQKRTPKHSPRGAIPYYLAEDVRPAESGNGYFPPMPVGPKSPHILPSIASTTNGLLPSQRPPPTSHPIAHSIAVLETGHLPDLPSPGSVSRPRHQSERVVRPRYPRQHTHSPTLHATTSHPSSQDIHKTAKNTKEQSPPAKENGAARDSTPPPRNSSPRPNFKGRRPRKSAAAEAPISPGSLGGSVPPINVLIVEDNIINLRLLEAFMKRLNVRWSTAMNGRIAVDKWRQGGFHLVLMDIQLPVMNGLDATKEIRRLEKANKIGVFVNNASDPERKSPEKLFDGKYADADAEAEKQKENDDLKNLSLFKSSVIIVALTASSLQSDRHEALAAGCNDFLTKPVNFDWLSRKVMEWGCMQALIDFDGWRKWKDLTSSPSKKGAKDVKMLPNGSPPIKNNPKSPPMSGKQKTMLGIVSGNASSGGDSSSEKESENRSRESVAT